MSKRALRIAVVAGLIFGLFGSSSALADGHESCGGQYLVSVEVDDIDLPEGAPVHSVSYCSDGTFGDFVPADGDGQSSCGGNHQATVETETIELPEGAPVSSLSYCSDGTIDGVQDLLP